jgi:two-component system, OmpR family, KDP operon response regulator KdpE
VPVVAIITGRPPVQAALQRAMVEAGFTITTAPTGLASLRLVFEVRPDVVLLDAQLPDIDAFELLRILRAASDIPVIVLASGDDPDIVAQAFEMGADDVTRDDTAALELVARLRAALRRSARPQERDTESLLVRTGALEIDRVAKELRKDGVPVPLTRTEYKLLDALAARAGQVAPHRFLLTSVWGDSYADDTHYLRVYIGYLRSKIEDDPSAPRYLVNEWGIGYRLARLPEAPSGQLAREAEAAESATPESEVPESGPPESGASESLEPASGLLPRRSDEGSDS